MHRTVVKIALLVDLAGFGECEEIGYDKGF
jgi:hypothetical protein